MCIRDRKKASARDLLGHGVVKSFDRQAQAASRTLTSIIAKAMYVRNGVRSEGMCMRPAAMSPIL
eukprot:4092097-Karenia_brevis.AAC.1